MAKYFLDELTIHKKKEVEAIKSAVPESILFEGAKRMQRVPYSLAKAITDNFSGVIAEFKRRSPHGNIKLDADIDEVARSYEENGACAVSVVTDTKYYGGSVSDLIWARHSCKLPIVRNDLIVDRYQVAESYLLGADAIILCANVLSAGELKEFTLLAHEFGLEAVIEVQTHEDISKIPASAKIVAVNNRSLLNHVPDIDISFRLISKLPKDRVLLAESGIRSHNDIHRLRSIGFSGFLIGEILMKKEDPGMALNEYLHPRTFKQ